MIPQVLETKDAATSAYTEYQKAKPTDSTSLIFDRSWPSWLARSTTVKMESLDVTS